MSNAAMATATIIRRIVNRTRGRRIVRPRSTCVASPISTPLLTAYHRRKTLRHVLDSEARLAGDRPMVLESAVTRRFRPGDAAGRITQSQRNYGAPSSFHDSHGSRSITTDPSAFLIPTLQRREVWPDGTGSVLIRGKEWHRNRILE